MVDLLALAQSADTPPASPDELLLELMDLVALSFPTSVSRAVVTFRPDDSGTRPALSDLDAGTTPDAPKRPELGHGDAAVLDTINHLLGELADATFAQAGVRVVRGKLIIDSNSDDGRDTALVEIADDGTEHTVMTRVFDRSELRWLLFTPELFSSLARTERDEKSAGELLRDALAGTTRFDIDMKKAIITFSAAADVVREPASWRFELLGSWLDETSRFRWGWANDAVDPSLTRRLDALRQTMTGAGLRAYTDAEIGGPEAMFSRLCRSVGVRLSSFGVYRAPFTAVHGKGVMFLALFPL